MQVLQVQLEVGADPAEVGRARRWARSRLAGSGIGDDEPLAETLILLISELVTNAVVHTGCPAVLRMLFGGPGVRVEVADASDRAPARRQACGEDTGGRGLELVDGLADRWGWQREGAGKRIWCEIDRGRKAESDAATSAAMTSGAVTSAAATSAAMTSGAATSAAVTSAARTQVAPAGTASCRRSEVHTSVREPRVYL
ncbi:ATP-binding protein [Streptomyces yangpuensis]|uniref:ATP-binding protein n=1 Tax=Streptomyces yangpuensis TaxID=1648182 RepID=UPI0035D83A11